ncbi:MAG: DNA helicase RecQ [Terrimicrobiaceae bacterium]
MKSCGHTQTTYETALKTAFGYESFRPMQREIIVAAMEGKDVFALLPTGGGKSLCFQLPALLREGLTVVVSPLIALMKDQVDQLDAAGVSATYLNSSLREAEARERLRGLHEGRFRLLYVAPERLMLENWKENLRSWNVTSIAIDEAHCISEWGHDFRPEYRQISKLRDLLPDVPVIALTATATGRVRADIIEHLRLRDPSVFVSSFFRPNLRYRVEQKNVPLNQISTFVSARPGQSGIIYCASRAATERVAESLEARGFPARPYHAGLTASQRSENQELFIRDEVPIICATIAFGMGINKPNVRWIIHHDLPKNMEGYYQETGRAGRDGLPSDCLLLFSAGDAAKQTHFIDEISDEDERQAARDQLRRMITFAECPNCRWWNLLSYFDETPEGEGCGNCDNCMDPRETYDGTLHAQKLLSCVYRIGQVTRFSTGLNHVIDVLTGSQNEKIRKWGHDQISTHGIGKDLGRGEWASLGRELVRLGLLGQAAGKFPTIEITPEGVEALRSRRIIRLTRPLATPAQKKRREAPGTISCDEGLFERLRVLRKKLADERGVPAYVILGDVTLRQMARDLPTTPSAMALIPGWGEKKLAQFAEEFAGEIAGYRSAPIP